MSALDMTPEQVAEAVRLFSGQFPYWAPETVTERLVDSLKGFGYTTTVPNVHRVYEALLELADAHDAGGAALTAPDKYDEAIDYLTEHPDEIPSAWGDGLLHGEDEERAPGSVLFDMAGASTRVDGKWCGCLTQIRYEKDRVAATPELTAAIRADHRIPTRPDRITVDDLPVFAEWQRRLDKWHAAQAVSS